MTGLPLPRADGAEVGVGVKVEVEVEVELGAGVALGIGVGLGAGVHVAEGVLAIVGRSVGEATSVLDGIGLGIVAVG